MHGMKAPFTASVFILAYTNSDPLMESLRTTLLTFTLVAHKASTEHDDEENDDRSMAAGISQRNRTTGESTELPFLFPSILRLITLLESSIEAPSDDDGHENNDDDVTAPSINAPEALSNMELCRVTCR